MRSCFDLARFLQFSLFLHSRSLVFDRSGISSSGNSRMDPLRIARAFDPALPHDAFDVRPVDTPSCTHLHRDDMLRTRPGHHRMRRLVQHLRPRIRGSRQLLCSLLIHPCRGPLSLPCDPRNRLLDRSVLLSRVSVDIPCHPVGVDPISWAPDPCFPDTAWPTWRSDGQTRHRDVRSECNHDGRGGIIIAPRQG